MVGFFGVALGGGIGLGANLLQRQWQIQDRQQGIDQSRRDEVRARMDTKADEILLLLRQLEDCLTKKVVISRTRLWPRDAADKARARALLNEIAVASGYLTQPLRRHVQVVVNLLPDAERLAGERWVDASAQGVAHVAIRWARRNLERYLRGERVPPDRGEPIDSYVEAWDSFSDMLEHQIASALEHAETAPDLHADNAGGEKQA